MITIYPYETLGQARNGWLDVKHHFNFATYFKAERMEFGALQVLNDDTVKAGAGFEQHLHKNIEIITYVREGTITHEDSLGNNASLGVGDIQIVSSGTGIIHSEKNLAEVPTNFFQIWIEPKQQEIEPGWSSHSFPDTPVTDALRLLVSGDGSAPLAINQDAYLYAGKLTAATELEHPIHGKAYVVVSHGIFGLNGNRLKKGDGAEVTNETIVNIRAITDGEILIIDVPA